MTYWLIIGCIVLLFGAVVFRGAPYVPTHRRSVGNAMDLLDLDKDDLVLDLGSGDGNILKAAAAKGYRAIGYEINPVLCIVARIRCFPERKRVNVLWRDFWLADFPQDAKAIFVFLAGPYMNHLSRKLQHEMQKRTQPLTVISHGFAIPGYLPKKISNGLYVYELKPIKNPHEPEWNPRNEHRKLHRRPLQKGK